MLVNVHAVFSMGTIGLDILFKALISFYLPQLYLYSLSIFHYLWIFGLFNTCMI